MEEKVRLAFQIKVIFLPNLKIIQSSGVNCKKKKDYEGLIAWNLLRPAGNV